MTTKITYNPTPDPDNVLLLKFLESEPIVDKFKGRSTWEPFWHDGEWVQLYSEDESSKLSKKQIMYLSEKCLEVKLENTDVPKKQHKPRQNMPYWAKDWRG